MLVVLDVVSTQQRSGFAMRRLGYLPIYLPNPTYLAEARRSLQEYGRTSTPVTQTNRNNPFDVCLSDLLLEFTRRAPPAQCEYAASPLHRTPQPPHCPTSPAQGGRAAPPPPARLEKENPATSSSYSHSHRLVRLPF